MEKKKFRFNHTSVDYYFDGNLSQLKKIADSRNSILITDENVFAKYGDSLKAWNTIVLRPGEAFKIQATVDTVIEQLIEMGAGRNTLLVGLGGGVVTDLTGYIASIFMRGISFGLVPSSLLAMVDASIGGKNGIDVGIYKNMVGTIRQPSFIMFIPSLLKTLPDKEWKNGFAEIIKHAAIKDATMFSELEKRDIDYWQKKKKPVSELIRRNALLKTRIVQADEFEGGDRKLLNFGHTLGHALENQYELSHGEAVSVGMNYAARVSEEELGFKGKLRLAGLIDQYGLPSSAIFDKVKVLSNIQVDKKKKGNNIQFVLLQRIGKAVIREINTDKLYEYL